MSDRYGERPTVFGSGGSREFGGEQPIEIHRHLYALRRARAFIVVFVVAMTVTVVALSEVLPKSYRATATIVERDTFASLGSDNVETVKRRLETIERLLGTNGVLERAAARVPGETRDSLESAVASSVDRDANIISITAQTDDPVGAASIANAVATSFLEIQEADERQRLESARTKLAEELDRLRASGARAEEIQTVRERLSQLSINEAAIGSDLQLAQAAEPSKEQFSPRPVRNGVLAFFAATFLAVLVALGRDLLVPRVAGPRELSRLMSLPVLASVPYIRRRFGRRPALLTMVANDAYQTLQASVRYELPDRRQVVFVTSALEGEGKTTAAIGLARALARVGQKTLLLCADFHLPTLHDHFGINRAPGLSDVLSVVKREDPPPAQLIAELLAVNHAVGGSSSGVLDVIASGSRPENPAELLFGGPLDSLFAAVAMLNYDYVIVDGPPLLGIADGHALAQRANGVIVVSRLDRLTVEDAVETRERLDRLGANPLGLFVVGVRRQASYYAYSTPAPYEEDAQRGRGSVTASRPAADRSSSAAASRPR